MGSPGDQVERTKDLMLQAGILRGLYVLATIALVSARAIAANGIAITERRIPISQRTVTFDEARTHRVTVSFSDYRAGPVDIYAPNASPEERATGTCKRLVDSGQLTLDEKAAGSSPACHALLAKLLASTSFELAISVPSPTGFPNVVTTVHALIVYEQPGPYDGVAAKIEIDQAGPDAITSVLDWKTAVIPKHVALSTMTGGLCYVLLDEWYDVPCDPQQHTLRFADPVRAVIEARLRKAATVPLIVPVLDASSSVGVMRRLDIALKPLPDKPRPPAVEPTSLEVRCKATVAMAEGTNFYLVCVDVFADHTGIVTLKCSATSGDQCTRIGELVEPRWRFIVAVWHDPAAREDVTLSGDAGHKVQIREAPDAIKKTENRLFDLIPTSERTLTERPAQLWYFDERKTGTIDLSVKATKPKDGGNTEVTFPWKFTVVKYYEAAVRLGLGVTWAPWDRKVAVQTTGSGQHYSQIIEGEDSGIVRSELVVGFSYFLCKVRDESLDTSLALGLRLGLVNLGTDGKWFRSAMVGIEGALGPDLSLGVFGGAVFNDIPEPGYAPGALLPANATTIPTHVGATAAFGVVLNFTPGFLKVAGVVK